jgi:hypothetical protein
MAWRVSWAALCRRPSWARPTPKTKNEPRNKQANPAATRCEIERPAETVSVVMSPSVRPIFRAKSPTFCPAGLLTHGFCGLNGLPGFPVANCSNLTAHSCGGSHGFGPDWVVLTVFPIMLLADWFRSTEPLLHDRATAAASIRKRQTASRNSYDGCQLGGYMVGGRNVNEIVTACV